MCRQLVVVPCLELFDSAQQARMPSVLDYSRLGNSFIFLFTSRDRELISAVEWMPNLDQLSGHGSRLWLRTIDDNFAAQAVRQAVQDDSRCRPLPTLNLRQPRNKAAWWLAVRLVHRRPTWD